MERERRHSILLIPSVSFDEHFGCWIFLKLLFPFLEKIQAEDIQKVARRFLSSSPALAARGQIQGLPTLKDIQAGILQNGVLPGKRLSLFR